MSIIDVKEKNKRKLLSKKNVHAVGIGRKNGDGDVCVVVSVTEKVPLKDLKRRDRVPKKLKGCITDVVERPPFRLLGRTDRVRPAVPGISLGHTSITAGTFGCLVENTDGTRLILSNNHVLAAVNKGVPGDSILQPGPADGGTEPDDMIGLLLNYVPIEVNDPVSECPIVGMIADILNGLARFVGSRQYVVAKQASEAVNLFDAALAMPTSPDEVSPNIMDIGIPAGWGSAAIGDHIKKSGRTTGLTDGVVEQVQATVQVQMDLGVIAVFEDQVISNIGSDGGDSGSAILNDNNEVVGLLFAGGGGSMVFNRIEHILSAYNVKIVNSV
jgi:hypothetical protein